MTIKELLEHIHVRKEHIENLENYPVLNGIFQSIVRGNESGASILYQMSQDHGNLYATADDLRRRRNKLYNLKVRRRYGNGWYGEKGKRALILNELYAVTKGYCAMCRERFDKKELEIDHIVKIADGGKHDQSNMQLLCVQCHDIKDNEKSTKPHGSQKRISFV